jgi:hypothetical protein
MWLIIFNLLRTALQHLLLSFLTERLLKDVLILGLEKVSKKTTNTVDDELLEVVKRALYPDYEAGQPIGENNTADEQK